MRRGDVHALIAARRDVHLADLRTYLSLPSASQSDPASVRRCAEFLVERYRALGCQTARVEETSGLPAVWAACDDGAGKTLATYSYFDTNTPGVGWSVDPYAGVVAERAPFKRVLYGRGCGSKGAALAFLHAVGAIREVEGCLPVNVMFLQEGEEFLGSPHVAELIERHRSQLERADAALWPGLCQGSNGDPSIFLGNKGCLKVEITCSSERWARGPKGAAAHGSTQGVVDHPVWRLVHALATLYDPQRHRILVDGFYDGLRAPSPAELALIDALAARYTGRELSAIPGIGPAAHVDCFVDDITGAEVFRRFCFEPTINIDGLRAGFTGPGTPGWTLPHTATCSIDHRLPPDLNPQASFDKLRAHLDRRGYGDLELRTLMMVEAQTLDHQTPLVQAALRVFAERGLDPIIWPRRGLSGPEAHYNRMLGLPVVGSTGLGYATGHAAPDEFIVIEGDGRVGGLVELTQSFADLIYSFASS